MRSVNDRNTDITVSTRDGVSEGTGTRNLGNIEVTEVVKGGTDH